MEKLPLGQQQHHKLSRIDASFVLDRIDNTPTKSAAMMIRERAIRIIFLPDTPKRDLLKKLFQLHYRRVFIFCLEATGSREKAENLTIEIFVSAFHHIGGAENEIQIRKKINALMFEKLLADKAQKNDSFQTVEETNSNIGEQRKMSGKCLGYISNSLYFLSVSAHRFARVLMLLLSLIVLFFLTDTRAQQASDFDAMEGADKSLVSIPISVSDREGHYLSNLKKDDFTVYRDGVKQKISFFAKYDEPLSIALLLDTSGSTTSALEKIKNAAKDFVDLLNPEDQCLLVTFDSKIKRLNQFTSDKKSLKKSLEKVETAAQDGTLMRSAVTDIAQNDFKNIQGRKVIVLLSDGKDLGSDVSKEEMLARLEESDVLIYSVFYKTGIGFTKLVVDADGNIIEGKKLKNIRKIRKPKKHKGYAVTIPAQEDVPSDEEMKYRERQADIESVNFLKQMSDTTAGRFYLSSSPNLGDTFKKVAAELRQQYRLGFHAKELENAASIHEIEVKVDQKDAVVRTRGKYRARQL